MLLSLGHVTVRSADFERTRKLPHRVDRSKMETSASSRKSDEEVPIHGNPDPGDLG